MQAKRVAETEVRMAQVMTPNDANVLGKVFGGSILALIDLTASATSSKFAGRICVTAAFDRVDFLEPVEIGELVELDGFVSYVGRTSVEVTISVHATRLVTGARRHVNTARVTMVAVEDGKPVEVPRLICETREEKLRFLAGKLRRELRVERTADMTALTKQIEGLSESELDNLLGSKERICDHLRAN
ncbi:MAG: acyl-CoA thioesterase [Fimbriimonadaceae bacterium]|nr:MAG: acyl-CoA thioesterase [Fimbriimonadaceae bacterium]